MIDAAKILQFFAKGNRLLDVQTKVEFTGPASAIWDKAAIERNRRAARHKRRAGKTAKKTAL